MRIVHAYHCYWPVAGGMEAAVRALAEVCRMGAEVEGSNTKPWRLTRALCCKP